ncbi:MAG: CNNM domain-containing protein [Phycisphaerae bacterium]
MTWLLIGIVLVGLFLSGFFSGAETGLYRVNRLRLQLGVQQREPSSLRIARVLADEQGALSVALVGTNVMNYITTTAVAFLLAERLELGEANAEVYTVIFMTPIVFVFGEVVPKNLFQWHADTLLARGGVLLSLSDRFFRVTGCVWALKRIARIIHGVFGADASSDGAYGEKRRVALLLQEALAGRTLAEEQSDLIDRVCQLSDRRLHSVMLPRNEVTVIKADTTRRSLVRQARRTGHACLPVYDSNRRHIIGLAKVDELLQRNDWRTVGEHLHPVLTLSAHETVTTALTELRRTGRGMVIVTDRGGQMLGVVTLKDLLSELVGEVAAGV